ncbi:MAG TPA: tRNA lysidine(34) synthetase TilS [Syntrophorhabdaceae bacterium]
MNLTTGIARIIQQERLIASGEKVLLGLSGGIDSTVLLHVLLEIKSALSFDIGIGHVNHLLRNEESLRDEEFVRSLAERFSLPFHVARVNVRQIAADSGKSLQHAGRDVRYRFFTETAMLHGYHKIGVAHTLDDQVETFILRIIKGTGMRGLSSIPIKRDNIIRPFLHTERSDIDAYRKAHDIPFVADSSNEKTVYERNFIRKRVIPQMGELNPAFRKKIFLLLGDLTAINATLEEQTETVVGTAVCGPEGDVSLPVDRLVKLDAETRFRVLAHLLGRLEPGFLPLREHMAQIEKVLRGQRPNLETALPHRIRVKKTYGTLILTKKTQSPPVGDTYSVFEKGITVCEALGVTFGSEEFSGGTGGIAFSPGPFSAYFDGESLGPLRVRTFREGDRFTPLGMRQRVKLKDFFMSRKIPREERRHIPLLLSEDRIIWVVGYRIDEHYKATRETRRIVHIFAEVGGSS